MTKICTDNHGVMQRLMLMSALKMGYTNGPYVVTGRAYLIIGLVKDMAFVFGEEGYGWIYADSFDRL